MVLIAWYIMKLKDKLESSLGKTYADDIIAKDREERKNKVKKQSLSKKSKGISRESDQRRQKLQKLKKFNRAQKTNAPKQGQIQPTAQRPQKGKPKNRQQGIPKKQQAGGKPQPTPQKAAVPKQFQRGGAFRGRRQRGGRRSARN
jgi:hypothetical protein